MQWNRLNQQLMSVFQLLSGVEMRTTAIVESATKIRNKDANAWMKTNQYFGAEKS